MRRMNIKAPFMAAMTLALLSFPVIAQAATSVTTNTASSSATTSTSYVVQSSDTLWLIAQRTGVSMQTIIDANHLTNPNNIWPGEVLIIPQNPTAQLAEKIINTAKSFIGVPYVWGGESPSGFDCSGLVQYAFTQNGVMVPRVSRDQWQAGTFVPASQLQPGDLVFFGDSTTVNHVGIYIGNDQFIQASTSHGVMISTLFANSYWDSHYWGARRILT